LRTFLATAVLICAACLRTLGDNFYVDPNATGANNGTNWVNAWTNLNNVVWGGAGVTAGDTLYISGGTTSRTYTNFNYTLAASGTTGNRIAIRVGQTNGHNGVVIFDGQEWGNHRKT